MDQDIKKYVSMMGLVNDQSLPGIYNNNMWHKFNSLQEVLNLMPKNENGTEDKHSIPDVYGRAIQLQISLEYVMRKSIYKPTKEILNWRGILTMLALQRLHHLDITLDRIDYKKEMEKFSGEAGRSLGDVFDKAISYPPQKSMFSGTEAWENGVFHMVCIKGKGEVDKVDVALFSPLTLIYPVADLEEEISAVEGIKWFDYKKKVFLNPTDVLSKMEKAIVCFWVDCLMDELREIAQNTEEPVQSMISSVVFHLEQYLIDLQKAMPANVWKGKKCFEVTEIDRAFGNANKTVVDKLLNRTIKLVLYLSDAKKIEYDKVFSSRLYYIPKNQSPFLDCKYASKHEIRSSSNWYAFLPLGKEVADKCSKDEIECLVQNLNMELSGNYTEYGICVNASLASSNIPGNIDIEKIYYDKSGKGEMIKEEREIPAIAIWPPECSERWNDYYIYLNGAQGTIEIDLDNVQKGENKYVSCLKRFPYAIALKKDKVHSVGMILPNYEVKSTANVANTNATVGIDFGTSGTTVYAKIDNGNFPILIDIGEDVAQWIIPGDNDEVRMLSEYFISVIPEQRELYSIYRMQSENMKQSVKPLLDGLIYQAQENEMIENSPKFLAGMKWDIVNNKAYYQAFIEELCLHIRRMLYKYGVTSVTWRYALPQGMKEASSYQQIWKNNMLNFLNSTMGDVTHTISAQEYTESEAASLYFLHAPEIKAVNQDKGYLVVDIGGGSMDIAVWQRKQGKEASMIAQTSIPVAGRLLFTRWLALNLNLDEIIAAVFSNDPIKEQLNKIKNISDINIENAVLERIVNSQIEKIMDAYMQKTGWAKRVERQLEFGMALLLYTLGSFVGYLKKSQILIEQDNTGSFCIALGGNGSKIMNWLSCREKLHEMFEKGLKSREVSSEHCKPQIILSQSPKKEVAYGLVQEKNENFEKDMPNIKEEISNQMVMEWNKDFVNSYNSIFGKNFEFDKDEVCNIMSNSERDKDVCNFFMADMYAGYYMKRIKGGF